MKTSALVTSLVVALVSFRALHGDDGNADSKELPPAAQGKIDFVKDIQPILERSCVRCHSTPEAVATTKFARNKGGLSLSTREEALRGGGVIGTVILLLRTSYRWFTGELLPFFR